MDRKPWIVRLVVLFALGCALAAWALAADAISIQISHPAKWGAGGEGPMDSIGGTVTGAPAGAKIVVFCYAGGNYWVQPWANNYKVSPTGTNWTTTTHLGEKYVALVVRSSFRTASPIPNLPEIGGDVLAVSKEIPGRK
jgi:hypothetical protein